MSDVDDVLNVDKDMQMQKIRDEVLKRFVDYKKTLAHLASDAPISVLCLPKPIENILVRQGLLRINDLFNVDFTKIKGLGSSRIRDLTACLDQFFSML